MRPPVRAFGPDFAVAVAVIWPDNQQGHADPLTKAAPGRLEAVFPARPRDREQAYVDKGYEGHKAPKPGQVFHSGQRRGVPG